MKIEIHAPSNPAYLPTVYADGKKEAAPSKNICDPWGWTDDELIALIGDTAWRKLTGSDTYQFNVKTGHFNLITGKRAAKTTAEIKYLTEYGIL